MKFYYENPIEELKKIVQKKAKYQKVMLLYDEDVSNVEIVEIYNAIKHDCVFNQSEISTLEEKEIFDGYRLIIYFCKSDSYLKFKIKNDEFINVFLPRDNNYLPFLLSDSNLKTREDDHMIVNHNRIDLMAISSFFFNTFFDYLTKLTHGIYENVDLSLFNFEIAQKDVQTFVERIPENLFFLDVDILQKSQIDYADLIVVDLVLIDALLVLFQGVKSKNLMLVDVYKSTKEDDKIVDKFYKFYNDKTFVEIIMLNFHCLNQYCEYVKKKILDILEFFDFDVESVEKVIGKVKSYAKNSEGILGYLYLYNIFSV